MAAAAAIPAWAIWTAVGAKALSGVMQGISGSRTRDAEMKQRNKELSANIAIQNKQMDQSSDQFNQTMRMKQKEQVKDDPNKLMNTMNMIQGLGQTQTSSADNLKYFLA